MAPADRPPARRRPPTSTRGRRRSALAIVVALDALDAQLGPPDGSSSRRSSWRRSSRRCSGRVRQTALVAILAAPRRAR